MHVAGAPPPYAPPPYTESSEDVLTMSTAMTYIVKRPARGPAPADIVEHTLPLFSPGASLHFPTPETLWISRDVEHEDWSVFLEQLGLRETTDESDAARQSRVDHVVGEWNARFFKPRGLRIKPAFDEGPGESDRGATEGLGFKVGNSFVGISLPPHSNGFGLRLPGGILLGVAVGKNKEEGGK
ncbi:hypothetical protein B0H67DRAFT_687943 [Lasiosphaeris hirsuta]|uniref:Uncharacterized protein n=1 Tax=Lasiosphaeris hirsuta TaxID=260670 RepID=A0AA39ZRI0_9PEZI|nr:hypothetical protein B0H67DRAFT_687943 [Lasiosphaeris hirsuta]